jgi:hypothetical protein
MKLSLALVLSLALLPVTSYADTEKPEAGSVFAASKSTKTYEAPNTTSKMVDSPPSGTRLVYRRVMLGANGAKTWYYVAPPGRAAGWVAAADTSASRPGEPPAAKIIKPLDSGLSSDRPTAAQTAAARGLSDSAKQYAEKKTELKAAVDQFITLEKTVEDYFVDPHNSVDGSYPDVTVPERKKKAEEFKAALK